MSLSGTMNYAHGNTDTTLKNPQIIIIIDGDTYNKHNASIERYAQETRDLLIADNYTLFIKILNNSWDASHLREYLKDQYENGDLEGVILIGDIPYITRNGTAHPAWGFNGTILTEYYTCFNTEFVDEDGDGDIELDPFSMDERRSKDKQIWLSIIVPPSDDANLTSFFNKIHKYRYGLITLPKKAFVYEPTWHLPLNDEDLAEHNYQRTMSMVEHFQNTINTIYPEITYHKWSNKWDHPMWENVNTSIINWNHNILINSSGHYYVLQESNSSREEYIHVLNSDNYEMIYITAHGMPLRNVIPWEVVKEVDLGAFLHVITSCYNGEWHVPNYIAGWYIFGDGYGICVIQDSNRIDYEGLVDAMNSFVGKASKKMGQSARGVGFQWGLQVFGDPIFPIRFYPVRIQTHKNNSMVHLYGESIQTDNNGEADVLISSYGSHFIQIDENIRMNVTIQDYPSLNYTDRIQYYLEVNSIVDDFILEGWYNEGEIIRLNIQNARTNRLTGDDTALVLNAIYDGANPIQITDSLKITSPKNITEEWNILYRVKLAQTEGGIIGEGVDEIWGYKDEIISLFAEPNEGNSFEGWYSNASKISNDINITFILDRPIVVTAKFITSELEVMPEAESETESQPEPEPHSEPEFKPEKKGIPGFPYLSIVLGLVIVGLLYDRFQS